MAARFPAAASVPRGLSGLRVLVVDNDPQALAALAVILRGWSCEVVEAAGRDAAQRHIARSPASLWLFDYHLDDGDTGVVLAEALADQYGARPALILSADTGHVVRRAVLDAGHSLLSKPLKPLALKSVLDRMLAASVLQAETAAVE